MSENTEEDEMSWTGGRKPNYEWTTDIDDYIDAWKSVSAQLEKIGIDTVGFDPDFLVRCGGRSFTIPVDCAVKIAQLVEDKL